MLARLIRRLRVVLPVRAEGWKWVALRGKLVYPYRLLRFGAFGTQSVIHRPTWIYGAHRIAVGRNTMMLHGVWLSAEKPTWPREEPAIQIGDRVGIRPWVTISASDRIVIGDGVTISAHTSLVDSDHTFSDTQTVMFNPSVTDPIHIGEGTWIGERVAVLKGARIGRHCAIGANSVVRGEIPDYSVAVGAPARVVGSTRPDAL